MPFELSDATRQGFHLAHAHAVLEEGMLRRNGLLPLSEKGLTHGEWVAKAQYWLTQTQTGDESAAWAFLSYIGAAAAGAVMASEVFDVTAGEEKAA